MWYAYEITYPNCLKYILKSTYLPNDKNKAEFRNVWYSIEVLSKNTLE